MSPAGKGRQLEDLFSGVLQPTKVLATVPGGILLRAIKPEAADRLSGQDLPHAMDARPIPGMSDETLLDRMGQEIAEAAVLI
jgi:hypothetical protein